MKRKIVIRINFCVWSSCSCLFNVPQRARNQTRLRCSKKLLLTVFTLVREIISDLQWNSVVIYFPFLSLLFPFGRSKCYGNGMLWKLWEQQKRILFYTRKNGMFESFRQPVLIQVCYLPLQRCHFHLYFNHVFYYVAYLMC